MRAPAGSSNNGLDPLAARASAVRRRRLRRRRRHPFVRADHPVDVDQAGVCAERGEFVLVHLLAAEDACGIGLAERDVAGRILVEQRAPVENSASGDGRRRPAPARLRPGAARRRRSRSGDSSTSSPAVAVASTILPPSKRQRMFSISVPWCESGLDARTTPSTRSLCGVVKHSSVGMLGWQYTPLPAVVPPPAQRCWSARPTLQVGRTVGGLEVQGGVALRVQQVDALLQPRAVGQPVGDRIVAGDARGVEDGLP